MSGNKINIKVFLPHLLSFILLFFSHIIYISIPTSDLANSIEHSGMDAVYVLTVSPVAAILALIFFILSYVLNRDYLNSLLSKPVATVGYAVLTIMILISAIFSVSFVASQYSLGFTAPINGTVWHSYSIFILISCIINLIALILLTLAMIGIISKKSK